uniref:FH2 domain-containing protein n=1 Tax=Gongylonema pulchrum TaxID=637853 RepID=A0A183DHK3_9BILA
LMVRKPMNEAQFKQLLSEPALKRGRLEEDLSSVQKVPDIAVGPMLPADTFLFVSFWTFFCVSAASLLDYIPWLFFSLHSTT